MLTQASEIRVIRRLPSGAEIKVRAGERLTATHVLAKSDPAASAVRIAVADQLGCPPAETAKLLMKPVGSAFAAGEALARSRKGLRNVVVTSSVAGTLLALDPETGVAMIAPAGSGEIRALVPGDVEFVDGKQSVSIRTVGHRAFGTVGVGPSVSGTIRVIAQGPSEVLDPARVTPDLAGCIVIGGSWAGAAALKKLASVGAAALVTGGFVEREIAAAFGSATDDRLALWRFSPATETVGGELRPPIALMATEGFGPLSMAPAIYSFLLAQNGLSGVVLTSTRVTGFLTRPAVIVPDEAGLDQDAALPGIHYELPTHVRHVDQTLLGRYGVISGQLRSSRRGDGTLIEVVDVAHGDDPLRTVPASNVEVLYSRAS